MARATWRPLKKCKSMCANPAINGLLRHWPRSQALGGVQLGAEPCFVALAQELNQTPDVLAVNFARKHALVQASVGIFVRMELLIKQYAPDDLENPDGVDPRSYKRRLKSSKKSSFLLRRCGEDL